VTFRATPRAENIAYADQSMTIHLTTLQDATFQTGSSHADKTAPPSPREMVWPLYQSESYQALTVDELVKHLYARVRCCGLKCHVVRKTSDSSEEYVGSILRIEEYHKERSCFLLVSCFADPRDRGDTLLQKVGLFPDYSELDSRRQHASYSPP
jgi:hypothetical protein